MILPYTFVNLHNQAFEANYITYTFVMIKLHNLACKALIKTFILGRTEYLTQPKSPKQKSLN